MLCCTDFDKPCSSSGKVHVTKHWGEPPANKQQGAKGGHLPAPYSANKMLLHIPWVTWFLSLLPELNSHKLPLALLYTGHAGTWQLWLPFRHVPVHARTTAHCTWPVPVQQQQKQTFQRDHGDRTEKFIKGRESRGDVKNDCWASNLVTRMLEWLQEEDGRRWVQFGPFVLKSQMTVQIGMPTC